MSDPAATAFKGIKLPTDPKERKEFAFRVLKELEKRRNDNPFQPPFLRKHKGGQAPFIVNKSRISGFVAGNRAGKTLAGWARTFKIATNTMPGLNVPVPNTQWIVSLTGERQREVIQPTIRQWWPGEHISEKNIHYGYKKVWDYIDLHNGSRLVFKSNEQGREAFQGSSILGGWFDEEPNEGVYEETLTRTVDQDGYIWITATPLLGMTWFYDRIYEEAQKENSEVSVFTASMYDNPSLSRKAIEAYIRSIPDEAQKESRIYGKFLHMEGLIYKDFDEAKIVVDELPKDVYDENTSEVNGALDAYCGIDTGRCVSAVLSVVDTKGMSWHLETYYAEDLPIKTHAARIRAICNKWGVWPMFYLDPSSQFFMELSEHGIPVNRAPLAGEAAIDVVQRYLKEGKIRILRDTNERLLWERRRYQWDRWRGKMAQYHDPKKPKPMKRHDHAVDAWKYMLAPRPDPTVLPVSEKDVDMVTQIRRRAQAKCYARQRSREVNSTGGY